MEKENVNKESALHFHEKFKVFSLNIYYNVYDKVFLEMFRTIS